MTIAADPAVTNTLHRAAARAALAPSVHNTQPWRFVVTHDTVEIRSDLSRQLTVLDPRARQLTISCGCALFNARVAIAAAGFEPVVARFPDPEIPELSPVSRSAKPATGCRSACSIRPSTIAARIAGLSPTKPSPRVSSMTSSQRHDRSSAI